LLCISLPDDYQSTLVKLKTLPQLSTDDHQQLSLMVSSSTEANLVNEKIVVFLITKSCYDGNGGSLNEFYNMIKALIDSELIACVQEALFGKKIDACFLYCM